MPDTSANPTVSREITTWVESGFSDINAYLAAPCAGLASVIYRKTITMSRN